jgi:hypothetical protein
MMMPITNYESQLLQSNSTHVDVKLDGNTFLKNFTTLKKQLINNVLALAP